MAAKTKEKETVVVKTQEEMYLDAERLLKATECLTRDKEKAEFLKILLIDIKTWENMRTQKINMKNA